MLVRHRTDSPVANLGDRPRDAIARQATPKAFGGVSSAGAFSIPDISLVEINAVPAQQLAVFLLEGASAVVFLLAYSTDGTWTSPLPLPKGEDEGEGLSSSWRT